MSTTEHPGNLAVRAVAHMWASAAALGALFAVGYSVLTPSPPPQDVFLEAIPLEDWTPYPPTELAGLR